MQRNPQTRHATLELSSVGSAHDPLKASFDELESGEPILVVRSGDRGQPLLTLAVKEKDSDHLETQDGDLLVRVPVGRYAMEALGQIVVVETPLRLDFDARPTMMVLGGSDIRKWVFAGCAEPFDETVVEQKKDLIIRLIRLAAKIGFGFRQFPELIRVAGAATNVAVRRLAKIFNMGLANPETINQAMAIVGELAELGLSDEGIIQCILHLREQEVRDLLKIIAASR